VSWEKSEEEEDEDDPPSLRFGAARAEADEDRKDDDPTILPRWLCFGAIRCFRGAREDPPSSRALRRGKTKRIK